MPDLDDHLVAPEVTRDEVIAGRKVIAMPALPPHASQQSRLDYVLGAHVAPGYRAASDLLTRHAVDSDFASDACVYRDGIDPQTGGRFLEELAFEVVSEQGVRDAAEKAALMHRRGVRRIFGLFVKKRQQVAEWSAESGSWLVLDPGAQLEDRCLVKPLAVAALLDAAAADNAVAEALVAKGNPVLRRREAVARSEGEARGRADTILMFLAARGIAATGAERQKILRCRDLERLELWTRRAATASSVDEVLAAP